MTEIIGTVLPYIAPSALPVVVVTLGIYYIQSKRKATKAERDSDSKDIHDTLLKHDFVITSLKDNMQLVQTVQEDIRTELNTLNTNVAKLGVVVENLTETVKEMKR